MPPKRSINAPLAPGLPGVLLFALVAVAALTARADGLAGAPARPVVVVIQAEWCGACEAAKPAWRKLRDQYGAGFTWVELDVSDRGRRVASAKQAMAMGPGVERFFARNFYRTPVVAFFSSPATEPSALWIGETKFERYAEPLHALLRQDAAPR